MSDMASETEAQQRAIFLSKVKRAREMSMSSRLAAGPLLFDQNLRLMRDFIRSQHPDFTVEQVEHEVGRRLRIARTLSDRDIYRNAGTIDE